MHGMNPGGKAHVVNMLARPMGLPAYAGLHQLLRCSGPLCRQVIYCLALVRSACLLLLGHVCPAHTQRSAVPQMRAAGHYCLLPWGMPQLLLALCLLRLRMGEAPVREGSSLSSPYQDRPRSQQR